MLFIDCCCCCVVSVPHRTPMEDPQEEHRMKLNLVVTDLTEKLTDFKKWIDEAYDGNGFFREPDTGEYAGRFITRHCDTMYQDKLKRYLMDNRNRIDLKTRHTRENADLHFWIFQSPIGDSWRGLPYYGRTGRNNDYSGPVDIPTNAELRRHCAVNNLRTTSKMTKATLCHLLMKCGDTVDLSRFDGVPGLSTALPEPSLADLSLADAEPEPEPVSDDDTDSNVYLPSDPVPPSPPVSYSEAQQAYMVIKEYLEQDLRGVNVLAVHTLHRYFDTPTHTEDSQQSSDTQTTLSEESRMNRAIFEDVYGPGGVDIIRDMADYD